MSDFTLFPDYDSGLVIGLPEEGGIVEVGTLDPQVVADAVLALEVHKELFHELTFRQVFEGTAHRDTETIYLRYACNLTHDGIMQDLSSKDYHALDIPAFSDLLDAVSDALNASIARAIIVKLASHSVVSRHTDEGTYADATDRWHVPLVTNDKCFMESDGEFTEMRVGKIYYFNNHVPHSAYNLGDTARIHLIVDVYR